MHDASQQDVPATGNPVAGRRTAAAIGAVFCACAVGLGAWSAHAAPELARARLDTAVLYLFLHGMALALFALRQQGILSALSLACWLTGCVLFCGSLVAAALWNAPTALAPFGGMAFMLGWLVQAVVALRRKQR